MPESYGRSCEVIYPQFEILFVRPSKSEPYPTSTSKKKMTERGHAGNPQRRGT